MNAVEKIEAAIAKLEEWRGVYLIEGEWLVEEDRSISWPDDPRVPLTNDPLVVALYRTIDAQLAILWDNLAIADEMTLGYSPDEPDSLARALALAEAILA
jgi:hypothetical protein